MSDTDRPSRRQFIKTTGAGATAVAVASLAAPNILHGADPTEDPVRVVHIGTGTRGWGLVKYTGNVKSAKVVGICDVYKPHMERGIQAAKNPDAKRYVDYEDVLDDPKVEAVIIATPDHWHEQMLIDASNAGKAVYCEKGWTMSVAAAKRMRETVKKNKTVMQLGHQGRQLPAAVEAGKMIRDGRIGPVTFVKTGRYFNGSMERPPWRWYGYYSQYNRPDPKQVVKDVDWERWLGPAPKIDFHERHFWHWRCYWPYGTGQAGDLLSHEMDQVQTVLGYGIPDTCMCNGLNAFWKDDRTVPDSWMANYQFEKQDCTVTFEGIQNSRRSQTPEYVGREGRMVFSGIGQNASRFGIYGDGAAWKLIGKPIETEYIYDPRTGPRWPSHMENFLQCTRTGEKTRCNEDEAFIEAVTLMMSVESYRQKRMVRWDPVKEEIV